MKRLGGEPDVSQGNEIIHGVVAHEGLRGFGDHELIVRIHEHTDAIVGFFRGEFRLNEKQRILELVPKAKQADYGPNNHQHSAP